MPNSERTGQKFEIRSRLFSSRDTELARSNTSIAVDKNLLWEIFHLVNQGQDGQAEIIAQRFLSISIADQSWFTALAAQALSLNEKELAVGFMAELGRRFTTTWGYHLALGRLLLSLGWMAEAEREFSLAGGEAPPDEWRNQCVEAAQSGRSMEAELICQTWLAREPEAAEAWHLLGLVKAQAGQVDMAIACFQRAVDLDPRPEYFYNLGHILQEKGDLASAKQAFQAAINLKPNLALAYNGLGLIALSENDLDQAVGHFRKAIDLEPDFAEAHHNLGHLYLTKSDRPDLALASCRRAWELKADFTAALVALLDACYRTCTWGDLDDLKAKLTVLSDQERSQGRPCSENPFANIRMFPDPARNLAIAHDHSRRIAQAPSRSTSDRFPARHKAKDDRLVIGYVSADFCDHATAHLASSMFQRHDRRKFKIIAYALNPDDGSIYRRRIEQDCELFVDLSAKNDSESAELIYQHSVDILVDLKGHTAGSRLGIFARRPAPVQVTYLGFPGSTGADFIDYLITDRIVTPIEHRPFFSETPVFLPHCYQVNDDGQKISEFPFTRADFRLPPEGFVFCSFNQVVKIEPIMFTVWMNILKRIPRSVLWLFSGGAIADRNLRGEAQARGVDPDRLVFAGRLPKDEHLGRLALADLALDTRIVNGHTTTADALWAGRPVITLMGNHFASRVSGSILAAIGLPELITPRLEDYAELAVDLAASPTRLAMIREKLKANRGRHPLFDTSRFVRNLERSYQAMWQAYKSGQRPAWIEIGEDE